MPVIGETVCYMSMSGMRYDALVKAVHPNGHLDLEVKIDPRQRVPLTDIEWIEQHSFATRGTAGPKAPA